MAYIIRLDNHAIFATSADSAADAVAAARQRCYPARPVAIQNLADTPRWVPIRLIPDIGTETFSDILATLLTN